MRARLTFAGLAVLGVLVAASVGYAAYLASRDSVGLPVTKLDEKPRELVPAVARRRARPRQAATTRATTMVEDRGRTQARTVQSHDDRSGRGGGDNSGPGSSGSGGGSNSGPGGGGDD